MRNAWCWWRDSLALLADDLTKHALLDETRAHAITVECGGRSTLMSEQLLFRAAVARLGAVLLNPQAHTATRR